MFPNNNKCWSSSDFNHGICPPVLVPTNGTVVTACRASAPPPRTSPGSAGAVPPIRRRAGPGSRSPWPRGHPGLWLKTNHNYNGKKNGSTNRIVGCFWDLRSQDVLSRQWLSKTKTHPPPFFQGRFWFDPPCHGSQPASSCWPYHQLHFVQEFWPHRPMVHWKFHPDLKRDQGGWEASDQHGWKEVSCEPSWQCKTHPSPQTSAAYVMQFVAQTYTTMAFEDQDPPSTLFPRAVLVWPTLPWVTTGFILLTISSATLCAGILASLTQSRKVVVLLIARHFLHFVEAKEGVGAKLKRADFLAKNQPHAVLQVSIGLSQAALSTTWSAVQPLSADLTQSSSALGDFTTVLFCCKSVGGGCGASSAHTWEAFNLRFTLRWFAGTDSKASSAYANTTPDFHLPK